MHPNHWKMSWMSQGMSYRRAMASDSVGRGKSKKMKVKGEASEGGGTAHFIFHSQCGPQGSIVK